MESTTKVIRKIGKKVDEGILTKLQAYDGTDWQNLKVQNPNFPNLRVSITHTNAIADVGSTNDYESPGTYILRVGARLMGFNGSTWDRLRTHMGSVFNMTSTGPTSYVVLVSGFDKFSWHCLHDANSNPVDVALQGSLDASNWFDLDRNSSTENWLRHVVNKPIRYIRFYVYDIGDATNLTLRWFAIR